MLFTNDYTGRFNRAMKDAGLDVSAVAEGIGLTYQAVKKVQLGTTKMLTAENNVKAARIMGVSSEWLATGEGSPAPTPLSLDLIERIKAAGPAEARKIENELRIRLDMPPLPLPLPSKRQRAA